jgi:HK97 family phage portal protein
MKLNPFQWFARSKPETYDDLSLSALRGQINSSAGVTVNETTAMNLVDVFACVRAISETLATLPFPVYQRLDGGGKDRLRSHPVYKALNVSPSPDDSLPSIPWREAGMGHLLTWGNWYNEIETTVGGELLGLHLLAPNKVKPERTKSGKLQYIAEGSYVPIPADRMLHVAGFGFDGMVGYSPIKMGKSAIALAMATERFGSSWFGNGSRGQGVITHPQKLSPEAKKNLRESLSETHGGPDNAHRWMIFEEGISVTQLGVPPEDAQFLSTRVFQLQEICRLFRISPVIVQDLSRSTFSNGEQEWLSFVTHTLRPWCRRIENEFNRKLFNGQDDIFCEHLLDGLLRGDEAARNASYATGRQWGWLCADDINELENRNPLPDRQGKIFLVPANMIDAADYVRRRDEADAAAPTPEPAPVDPEPTEAEPTDEPAATSEEAVAASLDCVQDNVERMLRREVEAIRNAAKKPKQFLNLIDLFYGSHSGIVQRAISPSLRAFAALKGIEGLVSDEPFNSSETLLELAGSVSEADLAKAVEAWAEKRLNQAGEIVCQLTK